ncbi:MAG: hypothetical protein KF746_05745 [Chitinophagaceae bacterium]|nr:hypothetical protein [Chitinophagaceae bacterium]
MEATGLGFLVFCLWFSAVTNYKPQTQNFAFEASKKTNFLMPNNKYEITDGNIPI